MSHTGHVDADFMINMMALIQPLGAACNLSHGDQVVAVVVSIETWNALVNKTLEVVE